MNKKYKTLDKKWKEILYSASGFGPNLMMILMGAFFTDAVNPSALLQGAETESKLLQTISGTCLILPVAFSILWVIAKIFDGVIDVPLAALTDNLETKWGRRRPPIAICFLPMVISYALCWIPISQTNQLANTIWITIWALIFFATYTMCLIAFYGSLSTICYDEAQRLRVSSFKSFFDTITYVLVYAAVPALLTPLHIHIDKLALILLPTMATMLIPLFMIKEGDKFKEKAIKEGYTFEEEEKEVHVGIWESIKLTFINKPFLRWCAVNCCAFFGLQMFLSAMNTLIVGGMGLTNGQMAILNTCAFAPVPIMLYLFNKLKAKKGIRFAYQTCLISFAICILSFDLGSRYLLGEDNTTLKIIIGIIGGIIGSWAIGSFFMMPYMIPAQISSVEEKLTGKNHSAMYFAGQALTTSIVGAIASGLVYENLKMLWITKGSSKVVWAEGGEAAAKLLDVEAIATYNLGTLLVPIVVSICCIAGFFLAFRMPKNYSPKEVAKELGLEKELEANKDLFTEEKEKEVEDENFIVNIALWVLSGSIFGIVWRYGIMKNSKKFSKGKFILNYIISLLVPPYYAFVAYKCEDAIYEMAIERGVKTKNYKWLCFVFSFIGLGLVSYIITQSKLNRISATYEVEVKDVLQEEALA